VTRGQAKVDIKLVRGGNGWLISSYDEAVDKGAILDPGSGGDDPPQQPNPPASRAALAGFVQNWWNHQNGGDAAAWAADFLDPCDYCYPEVKGRASSRAYITKDRQSLINDYPQRVLRANGEPDVQLAADGLSATMRMVYHYAYQGRKYKSGTATLNLNLLWRGGAWRISKYAESVRKD
jgi:hypothetical protein